MEFTARIIRIIDETHDVRTFLIIYQKGFSFIAGQFCMVSIPGYSGPAKPLTFASSPTEKKTFILTFKKMGDFTQKLWQLKVDDSLNIKGPCGKKLNFTESVKEDVIFLAGGTGITPFMSALKYAFEKRMNNRFYLFYGNQSPDDIIYRRELDGMQKSHANFMLVNTVTRPDKEWKGEIGFISKEMIERHIKKEPADYIWYICGPPAMNASMNKILSESGVSDSSIRIDPWELPGKTDGLLQS